jgi:hypothetical protein
MGTQVIGAQLKAFGVRLHQRCTSWLDVSIHVLMVSSSCLAHHITTPFDAAHSRFSAQQHFLSHNRPNLLLWIYRRPVKRRTNTVRLSRSVTRSAFPLPVHPRQSDQSINQMLSRVLQSAPIKIFRAQDYKRGQGTKGLTA